MKFDLYSVGGHVRDGLLGIDSKDIDYTVVIHDRHLYEDPYQSFVEEIGKQGYDIFENKPSCYTVRSRFPDDHQFKGLVADFVVARKEIGYEPQSRVPITDYGSLEDDLIRRDFTVNALAKDSDGYIIDLFKGLSHLNDSVLVTPTDTAVSFTQDPLRILRGLRFTVTKGFYFSDEILDTIRYFDAQRMVIVSPERVRNELIGMFKFDTKASLRALNSLRILNNELYDSLFEKELWFLPTFQKR